MATYVKAEAAIEKLCNKLIDAFGTTDTWRVIITTDASASLDGVIGDVTQIGNSNGYTTGGENATFNSTRSGAIVTATAADIVWTATGGSPLGNSTTGRYFWLYDDTAASDDLWSYWDYGATFTVASGETMTWDVTGSIFTIT